MSTAPRPPVGTESVTNAAGGNAYLNKIARKIEFLGDALAPGSELVIADLVAKFTATANSRTRLLVRVWPDVGLSADLEWKQMRARIEALGTALLQAGLKESRFDLVPEPSA